MPLNLYETELYAEARARGYQKVNGKGTTFMNFIVYILFLWAMTWIIPIIFINEIIHEGWQYAYADVTSSIGVTLFVIGTFAMTLWQIYYVIKILFGRK